MPRTALRTAAIVLLAAIPGVCTAQATPAPEVVRAVGHGTAEAPASTVLVAVLARGAVDVRGLQSALAASGVADTVVFRPRGVRDLTPVTIRGRVLNATRERLDGVAAAARSYARTHPASIESIDTTFYGLAAECAAVERNARNAALADARRRAEPTAAAQHERAGAVVSVRYAGGCPAAGPLGGTTAFDAATSSIRVHVTATVTFTAQPAGE